MYPLPHVKIVLECYMDTRKAVNGWTGCGYIIIDPNTGAGAYMISGGMNGSWITGLIVLITALLILAIVAAICVGSAGIGCAILLLLMPFYTALQAWIATQASEQVRECVTAILISVLSIWAFMSRIPAPYLFLSVEKRIFSLLIGSSVTRIGRACYGIGIAH